MRCSQRSDRPGAQPRRGRRKAVRHRLRELHRRLARVLSGLRADARGALHARHRPLPSDRNHHRQDQRGADRSCRRFCCTSAAASAGTAITSSSSATISDAIAQELVRGDLLSRTHIGLDYFDASINRVAAWVIGARNTLKALLQAMLEPTTGCARARRPATTPRAWRCWRRSRHSRGARCGIVTAALGVPTASGGSTR